MIQIEFNFLGRFEILINDEQITGFHTDKARALLTYLALEPRPHTRRALAALFWPEIGDRYAMTNLRNTLYRLRQTLDGAQPDAAAQLLTVSRHHVQFNDDGATVDVNQFHTLLDTAAVTGEAIRSATFTPRPAAKVAELAGAVALYQGELLEGFALADAPAFGEWLLLRREVLHQEALHALCTLAYAYEMAGHYEHAYAIAQRWLALDPYEENASRQVMRLLALLGQPYQALRHFDQMAAYLRTEMGVEPSEQSRALAKQIAAGEVGKMPTQLSVHTEVSPKSTRPDYGAHLGQRSPASSSAQLATTQLDLSEVPNPEPFFGRPQERHQIARWLLYDRCRVVAILGIGGMGKTTLAARCVREVATATGAGQFDSVLWRSLINAPPLTELLPPLLRILSAQQLSHLPESLDEQLRLLRHYLHEQRVLLVLDNLESILEVGQVGAFSPGYEAYGQLIQQVATCEHQSHLLLTSRERPPGYVRLEGDSPLVRSLQLNGLDDEAGHELLVQRGLHGIAPEAALLIQRYSGNPLALKLVADTVEEIFNGDIVEFLTEETLVFDDIRTVLDQQFARLSPLERALLFWLAVEREAIPAAHLRENLLQRPTQHAFVEALRSLQRRSLIERLHEGFTVQNVVIEYLTNRLVEQVSQEIVTGKLTLFHHHALLKAQAKEYIRESQARLLLTPIGERLVNSLGRTGLVKRLQALLHDLRGETLARASYAGGNLLNLLLHLGISVTGYDFSHLALRQANLQRAILHDLNFTAADLSSALFMDDFGFVFAVAVSPDGQLLAAATDNGQIRLWRWSDRQPIAVFTGHVNRALSVVFSPNGKLLISSGMDQTVRIWDVAGGVAIHTLRGHSGAVRNVAVSPDSALLASCSQDQTVRVWRLESGKPVVTLQGHSDWVNGVAFHPNGRLLATGGHDQTVVLWDLQPLDAGEDSVSTTPVGVLHGHEQTVVGVAFSPDGHLLASSDSAGIVRLWSVAEQRPLATWQGHRGWIRGLAFSPDSHLLASGSSDRNVRLWDVATGRILDTLHCSYEIWSLAFHPDGSALVCGVLDGTLSLWTLTSQWQGQPLATLHGNIAAIGTVAFHPDGTQLAAADENKSWVRLWQHENPSGRWRTRHLLIGHTLVIRSVAFSPDGQRLASASEDKSVRIWDVATARCMAVLQGHTAGLYSVVFSPDGKLLASAGSDATIGLWQVDASGQGHLHKMLQGHTGVIYQLAFRPQGDLLASVGEDHTLRLWHVASGECLLIHKERQDNWSVAFSSDGEILACGGREQIIRLWHMRAATRGQELRSLGGHTGNILGLAFSPDGSLLASASEDGTVRVWAVATGTERQRLLGSGQSVGTVAFHHNGETLASGSFDGLVRLWQAPTGDLLDTLRPPGPYEGMNITDVTGITAAQKSTLLALGAVETHPAP